MNMFSERFLALSLAGLLALGAAGCDGMGGDDAEGEVLEEIVSDDFSSTTYKKSVWEFVNPRNDASTYVTGTQLAISVKAGLTHSAWLSPVNTAPRFMQRVRDKDFEVEVKFESSLTETSQGHGILVEETPERFLRFDTYSRNGQVFAQAALVSRDGSEKRAEAVIEAGTPTWLRVKRTGSTWKFSSSLDGQDWQSVVVFEQALVMRKVGVFAANWSETRDNAPAYTALIDYFFNTAAPVVPEDGGAAN